MIISFQTWEGLVPLQKWGMEEEKEGGSGEGEQCYGGGVLSSVLASWNWSANGSLHSIGKCETGVHRRGWSGKSCGSPPNRSGRWARRAAVCVLKGSWYCRQQVWSPSVVWVGPLGCEHSVDGAPWPGSSGRIFSKRWTFLCPTVPLVSFSMLFNPFSYLATLFLCINHL